MLRRGLRDALETVSRAQGFCTVPRRGAGEVHQGSRRRRGKADRCTVVFPPRAPEG